MDATKGNGLTAEHSQPAKTHTKTLNAAIVAFPGITNNCDKPNLIARLARAGHLVHEGSEHSFTVVHPRWGMSRYCADFGALQRFARTVGVQHG
jgi:hypothetical protein